MTKENNKKILEQLRDYKNQINAIQTLLIGGTISPVAAAEEIEKMNEKERKLKELLVNQNHVTNDGKPRKIAFQESKQLFYTIMPDKTKLYAKSKDALYEKILCYYNLSIEKNSVQNIFNRALKEKQSTENCDTKTLEHYRSDFRRFITNELATKEIASVTSSDLKAYTQTLVTQNTIKKKAFLGYKGLLNLIFTYALSQGIIKSNPVLAIQNKHYLKSCDTHAATSEEKIFSLEEIEEIKAEVRKRMVQKKYQGYFINGYAILFCIETGVRAGELCALKWTDILEDKIHIHAQQLYEPKPGGKHYYLASYTKDEKGISNGGRYFPINDSLRSLLRELKELQEDLGISSEFIFCNPDGQWIKTQAYQSCLRRLLSSIGHSVTNNHAFRMSLNSNVLIPCGLNEAERALILGHSIQTNLTYYSYTNKYKDVSAIADKLNGHTSNPSSTEPVTNTKRSSNIYDFKAASEAIRYQKLSAK